MYALRPYSGHFADALMETDWMCVWLRERRKRENKDIQMRYCISVLKHLAASVFPSAPSFRDSVKHTEKRAVNVMFQFRPFSTFAKMFKILFYSLFQISFIHTAVAVMTNHDFASRGFTICTAHGTVWIPLAGQTDMQQILCGVMSVNWWEGNIHLTDLTQVFASI